MTNKRKIAPNTPPMMIPTMAPGERVLLQEPLLSENPSLQERQVLVLTSQLAQLLQFAIRPTTSMLMIRALKRNML